MKRDHDSQWRPRLAFVGAGSVGVTTAKVLGQVPKAKVEQSSSPRNDADGAIVSTVDGVYVEFMDMISALWASRQRSKILTLASALVAVVGVTAYVQIRLNAWNQPFYNALANRDLPEFFQQLGVFTELAGILLVLNVAQMWLNQASR